MFEWIHNKPTLKHNICNTERFPKVLDPYEHSDQLIFIRLTLSFFHLGIIKEVFCDDVTPTQVENVTSAAPCFVLFDTPVI